MALEIQNTNIPTEGFIRLKDLLKLIPVGKSSWWAGVKTGKYPQPVKLGAKTTAWRNKDILNLIKKFEGGANV